MCACYTSAAVANPSSKSSCTRVCLRLASRPIRRFFLTRSVSELKINSDGIYLRSHALHAFCGESEHHPILLKQRRVVSTGCSSFSLQIFSTTVSIKIVICACSSIRGRTYRVHVPRTRIHSEKYLHQIFLRPEPLRTTTSTLS